MDVFRSILSNEDNPPFVMMVIAWNEDVFDAAKKIKYGMVIFLVHYICFNKAFRLLNLWTYKLEISNMKIIENSPILRVNLFGENLL